MNTANPSTIKSNLKFKALKGWLFVVMILCCIAGVGASLLNTKFYSVHAPFFDSMAYHTQTHYIMKYSQEKGFPAAVMESTRRSTVFLPQLIAAMLGKVTEPSRNIGILIQTAELALFGITLFIYLHHIRRIQASLAAILFIPFLSLHCLYDYNGGLSDFRMDLSLSLGYGTVMLWYLIARVTGAIRHFVMMGVSCSIVCLFRATAPVYLVFGLGPLVAWDVLTSAQRRLIVVGLFYALSIATVLCGWFFLVRFDYLHYYYVIWNVDANAKLPLSEAIRHALFAVRHIGWLPLSFMALFHLFTLFAKLTEGKPFEFSRINVKNFLRLDLGLLWLGVAPTIMLIIRGAGMNPFVSMPSAIGLLLFFLLPISNSRSPYYRPVFRVALTCIALLVWATAFSQGWKTHSQKPWSSISAHKQIIEAIVDDSINLNRKSASFGTAHVFWLHTKSLANVIEFDLPDAETRSNSLFIKGVRLVPNNSLAIAAPASWKRISGESDDEKLTLLVEQANTKLDYLILLNNKSAEFVEQHVAHNYINKHAKRLREKLLTTGKWLQISSDIANGPNEVVQIFRNQKRIES